MRVSIRRVVGTSVGIMLLWVVPVSEAAQDNTAEERSETVAEVDADDSTSFSRCRNHAPFFRQIVPSNPPIVLGDPPQAPTPRRLILYKTELSNAAGTLEVCAVRPDSTMFGGTEVRVALEGSATGELVPLSGCAVFTGRQIDMLEPSVVGTIVSRARVCLIETIHLD